MKEDRLSRQNWLDAGLEALATAGSGGIRIDNLCKALKVTKGSFYGHFKGKQDLMEGLFEHWQKRETTGLIESVETDVDNPEDRIRYVVDFVTTGGYDVSIEVAMRQWAQGDAHVRSWLQKVDGERLDFFTRQFLACGFDEKQARLRALSIYSITLIRGYMQTSEEVEDLKARMKDSVDLLLG